MKFTEKVIKVPKHDCDVVLEFDGGKRLTIQCRPSNADVMYEGSLDIILPEDQWVTCWEGDDMQPSKGQKLQSETRFAKQLVMELPLPKPVDFESFGEAIERGRYEFKGGDNLFREELLKVYGNKNATLAKLDKLLADKTLDKQDVLTEFTSIGLGLRK